MLSKIIKKFKGKALVLVIGFVLGWMVHRVQLLCASNHYIITTDKTTGEQYLVPADDSPWNSRRP